MFYRPSRYVHFYPHFDGTRSLILPRPSTHSSIVLLAHARPLLLVIHATILPTLPFGSWPPRKKVGDFCCCLVLHVSIYDPTTWPLLLHPSLIFRGVFIFCTHGILGRFLSWWIRFRLGAPFLFGIRVWSRFDSRYL